MRAVRNTLLRVFSRGTVPLVLGGDCSITAAVFSALSISNSNIVGIVYFDGDVDLSMPAINSQVPDSDACVLDSMTLTHLTKRGGGASLALMI